MEVSVAYEKTCQTCGSKSKVKQIQSLTTQHCLCCRPKWRKKNILDEDYFKNIDTEEKAYLLGMIQTDGSVNKTKDNCFRLVFKLQEPDTYMVRKFSEIFLGEDHVHVYYSDSYKSKNDKTQPGATLSFNSKTIFDDLGKLGVVPNKTATLSMPETLIEILKNNSVLAAHWFRGVIDGDGCIYIYKNGSGSIELYSISENWLTQVREIVNYHTNVEMKLHWKHGELIGLRTTGQKVPALLSWMYNNATIFLTRKKDKAIKLSSEIAA